MASFIFAIQMVCTVVFGGSQFLRLLETNQGVSTSWFVWWEAFILLNLALTAQAYRTGPSKVMVQTVFAYLLWGIVIAADLTVIFLRGNAVWVSADTHVCIGIGVGLVALGTACRLCGTSISDPLARGIAALLFKAVPQILLAVRVFAEGGDGLSSLAILTGHVTIITRLGQLVYSIRESGWDKNRVGSAISEVGNELSWLAVTVAWLVR